MLVVNFFKNTSITFVMYAIVVNWWWGLLCMCTLCTLCNPAMVTCLWLIIIICNTINVKQQH